ncbi:MAG TPA: CvpA family protein [Rhizomicrobium sp.]|jgi:membrane protein required for colicin V production|nr:CvpA family protein [Rhizomicrobium sp.]
MHSLNISWVDIAVVVVLIVSTILAVARGFVRETLSILAWAAAAIATLYFGPPLASFLAARISTPLLGPVLAFAGIFLVVLIPLSFVSFRISERVRRSPVGTLDRSLGVPFGIVRALALIGIAYLAISLVIPVRAQPDWLTQARLLPVIQRSSDVILSLIPSRTHLPNAVTAIGQHHTNGHQGTANAQPTRKTYQADVRRALDHLIAATRPAENDKR